MLMFSLESCLLFSLIQCQLKILNASLQIWIIIRDYKPIAFALAVLMLISKNKIIFVFKDYLLLSSHYSVPPAFFFFVIIRTFMLLRFPKCAYASDKYLISENFTKVARRIKSRVNTRARDAHARRRHRLNKRATKFSFGNDVIKTWCSGDACVSRECRGRMLRRRKMGENAGEIRGGGACTPRARGQRVHIGAQRRCA